MNNRVLQTINDRQGRPEYVLLPYDVYLSLQKDIEKEYQNLELVDNFEEFRPEDFIKNPIALLRIHAGITQVELARKMKVSQAYISKIEHEDYRVNSKLTERVKNHLKEIIGKE